MISQRAGSTTAPVTDTDLYTYLDLSAEKQRTGHSRKSKTSLLANCSLLLAATLFCSIGCAQQPGGKPVLSATPPPTAVGPAPSLTTSELAKPDAVPASVDPNYIIGPDDSLQINVWKEPTFTQGVLVRPDGMVTIPAVGDLQAAGRTPMQLGTDVTTLLKKFIIEPLVTVSVVAVNSKRVYLVGEVGRVGPMAMSPNMTAFQAIASAGGLTPYANKKHIYILRGEPGKQKKILFDYTKAVKTGDSMLLMTGDTIVVP